MQSKSMASKPKEEKNFISLLKMKINNILINMQIIFSIILFSLFGNLSVGFDVVI